jgi:hypothetical protein
MPLQHCMMVEPKKSKRVKTPKPIKILVPTDFSRNVDEALRFAVPLARQLGGKITLLHAIVLQVNSGMLSAIRVINSMNKSANEGAAHRLDKLARTTSVLRLDRATKTSSSRNDIAPPQRCTFIACAHISPARPVDQAANARPQSGGQH